VSDPLLQVSGLCKRFDGREVLSGVSLDVRRGSVFSVIGPSGAGKSVLLKCIAGILLPDSGEIRFDGRPWTDAAARADFRRRCSFLFQNNALFDSLTALENVALPLEQTTRLSNREIRARSLDALRQLEIEDAADRHPGQLSGGMQKRLALARAIVTRPELVFFDEPTAGLDPLRRNAVFAMIARYQRQLGFTALIVTHDLSEALVTSDRVALLDGGRIRFEGASEEFFQSDDPVIRDFRDSVQVLGSTVASIRNSDPS
jgi:ABC-type transport system involved in resistance to organic solvents, ATPase component